MGASAPRGSDEAVRANQAASRHGEVRVARRMHEFAVIFCTLKYFVQRVFVAQLWSAAVSQKYDAALDLYGTKIHHPSATICTVVQCGPVVQYSVYTGPLCKPIFELELRIERRDV